MFKWSVETRKIKNLKEHAKNPRILTQVQHDQLRISLEKFGLADKPIINTDGMIIGGHQRLKVLKKMGIKEIEVNVPDRELSQDEVDELCVRLNKNTGEWDWECLANEWQVNDLIDWGFNETDLQLIMDEDDLPPSEEKKEGCKCPTCGKKMKAEK